jgi:hypothetical protein
MELNNYKHVKFKLSKMEQLQFLTKEQITGILSSLEKDVIIPQINIKLDEIRQSDKYKENYNIIKDVYTKYNELAKQLDTIGIKHYITISLNNLDEKTTQSLNIKGTYSIKNEILNDLKSRLLLIVPSSFDFIIENMKQYINVDKYLYNEVKEKEQDIDYDDED